MRMFPYVSIATHLSFHFHSHEIPFPLTFIPYVFLDLKWVSCWQHIYWFCFCIHLVILCLLVGVFNSFSSKLVIDMCVLIAILLFLDLFFQVFFLTLVFCSCNLRTVFSVGFRFVCVCVCVCVCVYIYCSFLVCSYHEVLIYYSIIIQDCVRFLISYFQMCFQKPAFIFSKYVCGWFSTFPVCLPLPVSFPICNFLISSCSLIFST